MGIRAESCVVLACDGCGQELADIEDGTPYHFASSDAAYQAAEDCEWVITDTGGSGRFLCGSCVDRIGCAAVGHRWTTWTNSPPHAIGPAWWRYCANCGERAQQAHPGPVTS